MHFLADIKSYFIHMQDMGTVIMGKVESGGVMKGSSLVMMPNRVSSYLHIHKILYTHTSNAMHVVL